MNSPKPPATDRLIHHSINEVEAMYHRGMVSEPELVAYLRAWNAGPHFTQAVFCDGRIRNFDPENGCYKHLWERFGVRG